MEGRTRLDGKRILLGVSGSIAAYKAPDILRRLQEQGAGVSVLMTENAARFVSRLTFEALTGRPVPASGFANRELGIVHIDMTDRLDAAVIAPATANIIGKVAAGIGDDALTTALLAADCPIVMAPAMNHRMYGNSIVRSNIAFLKEQGVRFVEPGTGRLACGSEGQGRLADVELIVGEVMKALTTGELDGKTVLVTAGPTREPIDTVRFISNPSTGKMGFALASAARRRGADVILIAGPTQTSPPRGLTVIPVTTARDMYSAVMEQLHRADILIMAAAVSDFRPVSAKERKIKKQEASTVLELEQTQDILATVSRAPGDRLLIGFAAETDAVAENALRKLKEKNLDMIIANDVSKQGAGFASDTNAVIIFGRSGAVAELPMAPKTEIADRIMDKIVELKKK